MPKPSASDTARLRFGCGEVHGGCHPIRTGVELPGLRGVLHARPSDGPHGGDIHYLSVCGSGLLSRVCIADVAGHGDAVAAISAAAYEQLQRSVDTIDERRVLQALDRRISRLEVGAMATAVLATYFPPTGRLTISYAGHPWAWVYRHQDRQWAPVEPEDHPAGPGRFVGIPLGTGLPVSFSRRKLRVVPGDRLLLLSDGVTDAPSPQGDPFGHAGLERALARHAGSPDAVADALLDALAAHTGHAGLDHDDVTFFVAEFTSGPPGPVLWHVLRNRLGLGHRTAAD